MPCPCCSPPSRCCGTCRDDSDCQPGCRCCCCGPGGLPRCVQDNGPCDPPESPGACCLPGGGCVDGVSQTECETCGNTFCVLTITLPSGEDCPATGPGGSVWVKCGNTCEAVIQSNSGCEGCDNYQGQEVSLPNGGTAAITARCEEEVGYCGEWHAGATCSTAPCGGVCCVRDWYGPFSPPGPWKCSPLDTQEECEQCAVRCDETGHFAEDRTGIDDWDCVITGDIWTCYRMKFATSCDDCTGTNFQDFWSYCTEQIGPCGEWHPGETCDFCEEKNNPLP